MPPSLLSLGGQNQQFKTGMIGHPLESWVAVDIPVVESSVTVLQLMVMIGGAVVLEPGLVVVSVVPLLVIVVSLGPEEELLEEAVVELIKEVVVETIEADVELIEGAVVEMIEAVVELIERAVVEMVEAVVELIEDEVVEMIEAVVELNEEAVVDPLKANTDDEV